MFCSQGLFCSLFVCHYKILTPKYVSFLKEIASKPATRVDSPHRVRVAHRQLYSNSSSYDPRVGQAMGCNQETRPESIARFFVHVVIAA